MVFVQVAFATSTVLPTDGSLPSGARFAVAAPDHVVDLLVGFALGIQPALDDLDAVEVGADRVLQRRNEERRRLACRRVAQVAAHRHALFVAGNGGDSGLRHPLGSKSQPPKKRTTMRGPVVA